MSRRKTSIKWFMHLFGIRQDIISDWHMKVFDSFLRFSWSIMKNKCEFVVIFYTPKAMVVYTPLRVNPIFDNFTSTYDRNVLFTITTFCVILCKVSGFLLPPITDIWCSTINYLFQNVNVIGYTSSFYKG